MKPTKEYIYIALLLGVALFLRIYNLSFVMQFIPDQGWFYLSARDMLLTGQIPLVGPQTSHPWIHHGAHWTYMLGLLFYLFNYNPVIPAYFMAVLGVVTVLLFYIFTKEMFGKSISILSGILFATSPFIVMNSRLAYHTSPLPFFVIILFYCVYKWTKGTVWIFPFIMFLLGVMYNHEITTSVYGITILAIILFGIFTKKSWAMRLWNKKIIILSIIGFIIPMLPFILQDIFYNGRQTVWFLIWMVYRIIKAPLVLFIPQIASPGSNPSKFSEFFVYYTQIFTSNNIVATVVLGISIIFILKLITYFSYHNKKKKLEIKFNYSMFKIPLVLLGTFLFIGSVGLFIHRMPIEADILLISPFIILLSAISILWLCGKRFYIALPIILFISLCNIYFLIQTNYFIKNVENKRISFSEREAAVDKIIQFAESQPYNLIGKGELSDFPVFLMPYEYLLWWKGSPIDKKTKNSLIEVWEKDNTIIVTKIK